jgi:RimJ/RimL family protein N-acetyltransferase
MIRPATPADGPAFFQHILRHFRESGKDGDPIFHPSEDFESWKEEEHVAKYKQRWEKSPPETGWERVWILEESGQILGHATLRGAQHVSSSHRTVFAIGLERAARRKGNGRALTLACFEWAKSQPLLDWIDLYAFAHNEPALALYKSLGFQPVGTVKDIFRVRGASIDDVHMVLKLR